MNTPDFKFDVSGPYQPIDWTDKWPRKPPVATASTVLDLANTYYSILMWRGHNEAMSRSMRHAAVMMGEVDEPDESARPLSNPLFSAGFMALGLVNEIVVRILNHRRHHAPALSSSERNCVSGAVTQLLFALERDDEALAQYARQRRTGYLGTPSSLDTERVGEIRKFVRALMLRSEQAEKAFEHGTFDLPLQTGYCYDMKANRHYWSDPIPVPDIQVEDD